MNYADYIDSLVASAFESRLSGGKPFRSAASSFIEPRAVAMQTQRDPQTAVEPC
jgi:hypothetical protein